MNVSRNTLGGEPSGELAVVAGHPDAAHLALFAETDELLADVAGEVLLLYHTEVEEYVDVIGPEFA